MKKNRLGKSDINISELTLGCMSLGTDKKNATKIIDAALDKGINHLDTADLYDFGLNEEMIGEIIHNKRKNIILTTKVGNHFNPYEKDWFWDPSKKYILHQVKESLRRLKTDYIDFYMLHGGTIDDPIPETIEAFEQLKQEGIIRAYGISSIRPNVIREYVKHSTIDAVMMQYSLLDRRPEEEILDLLHKHQISVLARGPLAKGLVSNHAKAQITKKGKKGYLNYTHNELLTLSEQLETLGGGDTYTKNELALKYVLHHPVVASAVFGASTVEQINENTNIKLSETLPAEIYHKLQHLTKPIIYDKHK
ncbi:aldo/keto reductase [Oceanobacillus halophilus]|uniref:Aldo/keto reductase n=1 Tax=Oceanobacillus halophilus TaxID=930130 RepID=A0A495AGD7_9BACI|nr:aldo/keto reductase [Oceanobacillus halophilus]RKQ37725.1 aldo/keto reductase [Oceanobacillus halophilus]